MRPFSLLCVLSLLMMWGGCATPTISTAQESLAVIVSASQARLPMGKSELAAIYRRKMNYWQDGTKIQAVNLPAESPARRHFSEAVLGYEPEELEQYWNDRYFHGVLPPYVLTSDEAVMRFVAETPGAIGYVPYCDVDKRVAIVLVITAQGALSISAAEIPCPHKP